MLVSASILTCDFTRLNEEIAFIEAAGADRIHLDVMDGVFVSNLTFGPPIIEGIRKLTRLPLDAHLMLAYPHTMLEKFAEAGVDSITIHVESQSPVADTLAKIRSLGKKAGISLSPETPASAVFPYLPLVDLVLLMTVEPGAGGQPHQPEPLQKAGLIRRQAQQMGLSVEIQADGGISDLNAANVAAAGVDVAIVGSALFQSQDPRRLVENIQAIMVG